ncbi:importin, putative, partial [Ixodes scapularis]
MCIRCTQQCTEVLFLTIFHEFRETLAPLLLEMVQGIQPTVDANSISFQAMLNRDAGEHRAVYDLVPITILHVTSFIIERVGSQIMPYAGDLVHYLPLLWETSGDHNMLRCAIVTTLVQVVEGLGVHSEKLHPFLLPVVAFGVDILQSPHVYLLEDTLDLWWAVLNNTSSTSTDLLQLAHYLFPLF